MDDRYRLKIKVGEHEFEGEGPADEVRAAFEEFKLLVSSVPKAAVTATESRDEEPLDAASVDASLNKIMTVDTRVVSLTVRPSSLEDAILLLVYGQKILRQNDLVTGSEIMDGLSSTGGFNPGRIDRLLETVGSAGDVIVTGERRAKRYRLTNTGLAKARQVASGLVSQIP